MLTLHYYPGNASLFPHMLLREAGADFELALVDRAQNAQHSPAFLRLNPNGRIPVLVDGDLVLFETAAIGLYLCDKFPDAGLAPPPGTPARAQFYKWMVHLSNTPQAEFRAWFYPETFVSDPLLAPAVKQAAGARLEAMFDVIAAQMQPGGWLLDSGFSAADLYLLMMVRWGRGLPRPPRSVTVLADHAARVLARPAVQATFAAERLAAPFI